MSENKPTLSIVMPCFNHAAKTVAMIDSIVASTFHDWELLAIDDGSDEHDFSILQAKADEDERIHLFRRSTPQKGAPVCRNEGLRIARGEYIVFFDSDDCITPSCLARRVKSMEENADCDFLVFPSFCIQDGIATTEPNTYSCGYDVYSDDKAMFACRRLPFIVWNNIYRLAALKSHNIIWDENLKSLQDADFNVQAILKGLPYKYILSEPDYGYRLDSASSSISKCSNKSSHFDSNVYALEKFYKEYHKQCGNKYDFQLFVGALWIYNHSLSQRIDTEFSHAIHTVIRRYSKPYALLFRIIEKSIFLLGKFLPQRLARQIPMLPYLLWRSGYLQLKVKQMKTLHKNVAI